jgi:rsbT co-antagonist protein RsbR
LSADSGPPSKPRGGMSEEDRALIRTLGGRISQIIHGEDLDVPDLQRRDELGILANMLSRLAREIGKSRKRDQARGDELEARLDELQAAYQTQEKLLATIRELSSPLLDPHEGVVLLHFLGPLDAARVSSALPVLFARLTERRARVAVLHVTDASPIPSDAASLLVHAEASARKLGARIILSGCSPGRASATEVDLSALSPRAELPEALGVALRLVGYRITR